jgi:hypothetical protein
VKLPVFKETLIYSLEGALPLCRWMAEVKQRLGEHAPFLFPQRGSGRIPELISVSLDVVFQ